VIKNIFEAKMVLFCSSCTSKELVENMISTFSMS
jgi:hypothetical protein